MRTFIAIEIPKDIKKAIADYTDSVKGLFKDIKWVAPDNLHLTLKFLGNISETEFLKVCDCVSETVSNFNPFIMDLSHVGFYFSTKKARVIWIGADGGADNLIDLFQNLESCLEPAGFDRETRMFSSHLTIGRVKKFQRIIVPDKMPEFNPVTFEVKSIAVIKSTLTPHGPIYEKMFEGKLKQLSLSTK